ncbi:hypothetical protein E2C01_031853 [Portunus trituberculatus]|uniref:SGNH hydrolase-type esterase domain-containing protein n=1 Tax=Portunus trituberculatus TaxID=210409 RepID=A0A5B7EYS3_PORTR|nr:hypothetical protein [Portunus trituberculatus]
MQCLKQQISSLENNTTAAPQQAGEPGQTPKDGRTHSDHAPQNKKCLILGDTNLSKMKASDLTKDCCIRTLPEANFDLIRCWVKEQLSWTPETCVIIYCGLFDVQKNSEHAATLDNLGALLSELKNISENINVYVCQLVPSLQSDTLQSKISDYNENLIKWGVENGISVIKPDPLSDSAQDTSTRLATTPLANTRAPFSTGLVQQDCFALWLRNALPRKNA